MSEKRISSRTTKGRPPSRLGEWDSVSKASRTSSKAAELEVLVAEKEFEAAEELAQLEMETAEQLAKKRLELQRGVIQKRLAADKAAVALELSSVGSRHSVASSEAMMPIASAGKETQSPRLTTSLLERHAQFLRRLELSNLDTGAGKPRQGAVTLSRAGFDADPRPEEEGDLDQQGPENGAQSLPDLSKVQLSNTNSVDLQTAAADLLGSVPVPVDRVDSSGAAVGAQGTGSVPDDHSSIASVSWDHHQGVNSTGRVLAVAKPPVQAQPSGPQPSSHQSQRQITIHPATQVSHVHSSLNPGPGPSALNYNPVSSIRPGLAGVRYGLPAMTQPVTASVNTHLGPGVGRSYSVATTTSTSVTCGVTPSNWEPVTVQSSFAPISSVQGHSHRAQKSAATTVPAPAAAVLSGPEQLQIYNSMLSRQHLRPLELPRFSGKTNDYSRWKQRFKQLIDDDAFLSEGHKFARLREALTGGDAYELIAEIVDGPGAYNAALHELDAWYGGPTRDIDRYEKELMSAPRLVNERDLDGLKSFAVKLRNALINLSASGITPGRELYLSVTQKVPKSVLTRFMEKHDDSQCDIGAFSEYLLKRVQRLRQVEERMSGAELAEQRPSSGGAKFGKRPDRTFVATTSGQSPDSRNGCIYCNKDHALSDCREFKQLTSPQRWDFIKPKPVCICCFGPGHKAKSCKQSKCSICSRPHHRLLHYTKLNQRTTGANSQHSKDRSATCQDTSTEASAADKTAHTQTACGTTIEPKSVAFMTVATTAKGPTGSRKANVFLDSGSSCSFITTELVSQLGLQTTKANVPLDTAVLGGEKLRLERYTSAELCHADGQSSTTVRVWMLPRIMRPVPAFDWTEELKRWPHLSDVVPASNESRVDLLIGLNAPQLHISLAERFCSEGGPIARKTPLGWVLFGEGPTDSASEMTEQSLLAVSDSTLINTVNKFWDLESVGMQAKSTSSYLTPDEREADAMTVQSLHHNGTRFVVGIPWRGDGSKPKIQQRSEQYARKRLCSLHRLFQKNPTVQLRYSEVLQNYRYLADNATWWTGPAFLSKPTSTWPSKHIVPPAELPGQLKREITMVATTQELPTSRLHPDHFSSWDHLVRITAWCRRFVNNARRRSTQAASPEIATKSITLPTGRNVSVPELTVSELWSAKCVWISLAQREVYGRTFADVTGGKGLSASSPLQKLQPVLDATSGVGVLKVNGRLRTAHHLPPGIRTPVILPRSHRTTKLIIAAADANANHAVGTNHLLSLLAGEYWIVKGKAAVKEHRSKCILCRKRYVKTATPAMAPLPNFRTSGPQQPFAKVGVDYAGPFHTRQGRGRSQAKRYVCVFTCLLTRACHFELVYSLDTAGFLLALSRFTKRRGVPQKMVSDNGTNFVAADQELRAAVKSLDNSRLAAEMTSRGISWAFNPPRAPHFGGVFEVMVKSMKRVLQGVLYRADLTDEELHTALVNAEDLINSRPLCTMTSDVEDLQPLTPQHFLVGHANSTMAAEVNITTETQVHPRKRWEVVQRIIDDVWKRWLKEIVPKLNVQVKWLQKQRNVQEGDVVLVMDEHTARSHWPLGRVTEVYPGKDGIVRVVKVKVAERFYKRAVHRLVPLEVEGTE
eukprot:scpid12577/ scgid5257/ 